MKFLRALYMIIAYIVLFPVIVLVELLELVVFTVLWAYIGDIKNTIPTWLWYQKRGIEMNIDFIENGLK